MATLNTFMTLFGIDTLMIIFLSYREFKRYINEKKAEKKQFQINRKYYESTERK